MGDISGKIFTVAPLRGATAEGTRWSGEAERFAGAIGSLIEVTEAEQIDKSFTGET